MTPKTTRLTFFAIFLLIPVIWWVVLNTSTWGVDYYSQLSWWGRLYAIAGLGLFAGNLLLSGRHKLIDSWFGGLDRVYLIHRQTGIWAWTFITLHALAMGLRFADLGWIYAYRVWFELPAASLGLLLGRIGFVVLTLVLLTTIFIKMKYEAKKFLHTWLGFVVLIGASHALLISDFLASSPYLRTYLILIVAIGTMSFIYRSILGGWLVPRHKGSILAVEKLNDTITHLQIKTVSISSWQPGQFAFIKIQDPRFKYDDHPFSITDNPKTGEFNFAIKNVGDFTSQIPSFKPNTPVRIEGPYGGFSYLNSSNPDQVWIAGGIGVTPFLAMARHLASQGPNNYKIHFIYQVSSAKEAIYLDELNQLAQSLPHFTFKLWESNQQGRLAASEIDNVDYTVSDFFICGPLPMIKAFENQLQDKGVHPSRIYSERFKLY